MQVIFLILLFLRLLSNDLVELNTADERLLMTIPGIGLSKAAAIVEFRNLYGPFAGMDELKYVPGVGAGIIGTISTHARIDPSTFPSTDTSHRIPVVDSLEPLVEVFFLDVGQGDAILVRAAEGRSLLFDGGPDEGGALEPDVIFRLREIGVDTLHVVAFSHPHADHIGGLPAVLENFTVMEVLDPGMAHSSWIYEHLLETAMETGCDYGFLEPGMTVRLSSRVTATVEGVGLAGGNPDLNENCALLRVECGTFSVLLTGDIEKNTEMLLTPGTAPVTVLKVPHHGSASSVFPPYLRKLAPQVAVFSVGRKNPFGHPNPGVVETYREMGSIILRTDILGTIVIRSDGEALSISATAASSEFGDSLEE